MYFRQCSRSPSGQVTGVTGGVWAGSSSDRATVRKDLAASLIFRAGRSSGFRTLREVRAGLARAGGELSADVALGNGIATGTHVLADLLDERRAAGESIEQPIHLAPERLPRIRTNGPQRRGLFHRYRSGCHGRSPSCWRDGMTDHPPHPESCTRAVAA